MKNDSQPSYLKRAERPGQRSGPGAGTPNKMPPRRVWMWFALVLLINYLVVKTFFPDPSAPLKIPYTVFKQEVAKGNVKSIYSQGSNIDGRLAKAITWPPPNREREQMPGKMMEAPARDSQNFTTTLPTFVDPDLEQFLIDHDVEISAVPLQSNSLWATFAYGFGPAILIIAFYVWLYRRAAQGGGMGGSVFGIGKSKARRYD